MGLVTGPEVHQVVDGGLPLRDSIHDHRKRVWQWRRALRERGVQNEGDQTMERQPDHLHGRINTRRRAEFRYWNQRGSHGQSQQENDL